MYQNRNQTRLCDESFIKLAEQIVDELKSLTKLKELIEDNWNSDCEAMSKLTTSFRDIGIRCAMDFRQQTLAFKELLPLKTDIDNNLISSLPDDLYDSYNNDVDNVQMIKSLRQLIRLQISEFFKRILLVYVRNYHENLADFPEKSLFTQNIINQFVNIMGKLLENSKCRQKELIKIISFHKSFYSPSSHDDDNKNSDGLKNECTILWQNFRNVRKALCRSMTIINDCETILDQSNSSTALETKIKENLDCKLGNMTENLTMANEIIQAMRRSLQHHHITNKSEISAINNNNDKNQTMEDDKTSGLINECEPPKDEVFEAFIEDSESRSNVFIENYDDSDLTTATDAEMRDAENNMFYELRTALKDKHIEHRIREARAQGIELNREQIENEYYDSLTE
ncbi:hypothetical protein BLA29_005920, partial [Euroglyphus maynei]